MPSSLPKKPTKRVLKKSIITIAPPVATSAAPAVKAAEIKVASVKNNHGLAVSNLILIFLVIGCLAAAFLMSEKLKATIIYASTVAAQLAASEKEKADLSQQLTDIKTLQELANKEAEPVESPKEITYKEYSSANLSLNYPEGYEVVEDNEDNPYLTLTVKNGDSRIEIFRMKDFPTGDRVFSVEADRELTEAEYDGLLPKEKILAGTDLSDSRIQPYDVWVYYGIGDEEAKAVLDKIVASIKVVK